MNKDEEDRAISEVVDRLCVTFPELSRAIVATAVAESRPEFDGNPIRDFVPLFVERGAKHRLRQLTSIS